MLLLIHRGISKTYRRNGESSMFEKFNFFEKELIFKACEPLAK